MNYIPSTAFRSDLGSWTSTIKQIGGGALDLFKQQQQAKGQAAAALEIAKAQAAAAGGGIRRAGGGLPGWAIPAGIGAAALVLILVLKKK